MWLMLQQEKPENFVIATNEKHKVREFVELSFEYVGKPIRWEGTGLDEVGKEVETGIVRVRINEKFFRPTEVVSFSSRLAFSLLNDNEYIVLLSMKVICLEIEWSEKSANLWWRIRHIFLRFEIKNFIYIRVP